jgi:uncharacterized protein (TIGR03437 family)
MSLDNVTVSFDAPASGKLPAISRPGNISFVSPGQVNVYVPPDLVNYPSAQVKVTFSEFLYSNLVTVPLANYVPAFFSNLVNGVLVAAAVDGVNCPAPYIIGFNGCSAVRGQVIQLYANGLGPVSNPPANSGDPALVTPLSQTTSPVTVSIGGQQAQVQFAGLAPGFVGLYQMNVAVPANIGAGNQPILISVGGKTSPASVGGSLVVLPVK